MNIINLDVGSLVSSLLSAATKRPTRVLPSFLAVFVLAAGAALGFPAYRLPFAVTAVVALCAFIALGSHVAGQNGTQSAASSFDPEGSETSAETREDHRRYVKNLSELNSDTQRMWMKGEFSDPLGSEQIRGDILEAFLAIQAARLQSLGLKDASILIVRHDSDNFLVRRIAGPLKARLKRGDHCQAQSDLDQALRRYAPHSHHDWISCCGRWLAVAATASVPFDDRAKDAVEQIMYAYQTQYERLRLFQRTPALQGDAA